MIISNSFVRTYFFGSKVARIHNKSFECCVSTAKEGLFQKQSTIILEPKIGNTVGAGPEGLRACGKVIYSPTLRKSDRFQLHDTLAKMLDAAGEEGCTLEEALEQIFVDLKRRGIAVETMNLAADQGQAHALEQIFTDLKRRDIAVETMNLPADQFNLGFAYEFGDGVPRDYAQAVSWYRKAAEQGYAPAQSALGDLYRGGRGAAQDYAQAAAWYRKAAEQGYAPAQHALGDLYDNGQGVAQDYTLAAAWYRKAAEQGYAAAQYALGGLYDNGLGVPQDYAQAYFWLGLGAGELDGPMAKFAAEHRDEIASHLTPADLFREQERVRDWLEAHQAKPQ
jgi:Sel1 repeat